jgi:hypothetical protein
MKLKKIIFYLLSLLTSTGFINFVYPQSYMAPPPIEEHFEDPYFIGEMGRDWNFPSDHLPIGAKVGDTHIAFWNVLNKKYLHQIEKNGQGLKNSSILKDNLPLHSKTTLTAREEKICSQIFEMISHPTHPRALIALQESSEEILNYLTAYLPEKWVIITPPDQPFSEDVFIYDSSVFDYLDHSAIKYSKELPKTIFSLTLREIKSDKSMKFIQSHIPEGMVDSPEGCKKFSEEIVRQFDPKKIQILLGDMGQPPYVIEKALDSAAKALKMEAQPFDHLTISYPTHIDSNCNAEWVDNFFIYLPKDDKKINVSTANPDEICSKVAKAAELLKINSNSNGSNHN